MSETVEHLLDRAVAALERERRATYRVQLGPALRFEDVGRLAPYLHALGVSDVYLSPCFRCGPESSHGYDVTDHNSFNPEIGGPADFDHMVEGLAGRSVGVLLDVVPNHMGVAGDANPWWIDVLENGPSSPYARVFDISWEPVKPELRNKVLLPVLGDHYGQVLEAQGIVLRFGDGAFWVEYGGARLPVAPRTYALVLQHRLDGLVTRLGETAPPVLELQSILTALEHLPGQTETEPARLAERFREKEIIKRRLGTLAKESADVREFIDDNVRLFNGTPEEPASFDLLDRLLSQQAYRLANWRVAADEINYRRFFDVNHLAAIRMESAEVFEATHRLILDLVGAGKVGGLRIDHPDGLYAPGEYFARLQEQAVLRTAQRLAPDLDDGGRGALLDAYRARASAGPATAAARPLWIVAEKILLGDERLPEWWRVAGTTGYDFLASLNGLLVDRGASRLLTRAYARFTGSETVMADVAYASRRLIMLSTMSGEINELGHHLDRLSERHRHSRDFTLNSLTRTIREVIACFPVYRTYIGDETYEVTPRDRAFIEAAIAEAKRRNPTMALAAFDFLRDVLLLRHPPGLPEEDRAGRHHFVMRFQQVTGPVMAKGVEDTAFYIYNRLVSLNEVGGEPARVGESAAAFHERNAFRLERWPESLLASGTHDTKRGEDVRARISVLSEIPVEWASRVRRWRALGRRWRGEVDGRAAPDRNEEYLLYQTLAGAWPTGDWEAERAALTERVCAYMDKAAKEAKVNTSWVNPSQPYDAAVRAFVAGLLTPGSSFLADFLPFQARVAVHGAVNSLAQVTLKTAAPGIPDIYQGAELWDLSLVDPDNRRPVDFAARAAMLDELRQRIAGAGDALADLSDELLAAWPDGRVKLYVIHQALALRRQRPALFRHGAYRPAPAAGERAEHLVAFARQQGDEAVLVVVPRLSAKLTGFSGTAPVGPDLWADTWMTLDDHVPAGRYRDQLTGQLVTTATREGRPVLEAASALARFPVALLVHERS